MGINAHAARAAFGEGPSNWGVLGIESMEHICFGPLNKQAADSGIGEVTL